MKIEVLKTLKGSALWRRGTVFDDTVAPIPGGILQEVKNNADTVRIVAASPFAKAEKPIAEAEPDNEIDIPVEPIPEIQETVQEEEAPQETEPPFVFPEMERLIETYTSMRAVADLLNVSPLTVSNWRKGKSSPKASALRLIKKEYRKVTTDDQR